MKDINLNNFIIENSLDIPLDVSIGVVSVPTGLNYSDQIFVNEFELNKSGFPYLR